MTPAVVHLPRASLDGASRFGKNRGHERSPPRSGDRRFVRCDRRGLEAALLRAIRRWRRFWPRSVASSRRISRCSRPSRQWSAQLSRRRAPPIRPRRLSMAWGKRSRRKQAITRPPPSTAKPRASPRRRSIPARAAGRRWSRPRRKLRSRSAFQTLVASRFARDPATIHAMTREALQPLIASWLDAHLPALVENLVRAEIERITRDA